MLVERTHYKLAFEPEHLRDMRVTIASMSLRESFAYNDKMQELAGTALSEYVVHTMAGLLVEWNLEKAPGEPWPMTADGVLDLPDDWTAAIVTGWTVARTGISGPLDSSPASLQDEDPLAALPMETLGG
jgi:hypothetical protein